MKNVKKLLIMAIADYLGIVVSDLQIERVFRVSANLRSFDQVYLVYHPDSVTFFVIWRWTSSDCFSVRVCDSYNSAKNFFLERKNFALNMNNHNFYHYVSCSL